MIKFNFKYNGLPVVITSKDDVFRSWLIEEPLLKELGFGGEPLKVQIKAADNSAAFQMDDDKYTDSVKVDFFALTYEVEGFDEYGLIRLNEIKNTLSLIAICELPANKERLKATAAKEKDSHRKQLVNAYIMRNSGNKFTHSATYEHDAQSWRDSNMGV